MNFKKYSFIFERDHPDGPQIAVSIMNDVYLATIPEETCTLDKTVQYAFTKLTERLMNKSLQIPPLVKSYEWEKNRFGTVIKIDMSMNIPEFEFKSHEELFLMKCVPQIHMYLKERYHRRDVPRLLIFEGPDGSGKTTLLKRIIDAYYDIQPEEPNVRDMNSYWETPDRKIKWNVFKRRRREKESDPSLRKHIK